MPYNRVKMKLRINNYTSVFLVILLFIGIIVVSSLLLFSSQKGGGKLRVGYMNTWAEGAFPIEVMKNTDILQENKVSAEFFTFSSGAPIIEAALAGSIDVGLVGRVPAINLVSKSDDWFIAAKLAEFPIEVMAAKGSGIQSIGDLKGKKIGVPFATGPYALIIIELEKAGLDPDKDVTLVNMKPTEFGFAIQSGEVDAIVWGEPTLTVFKQQDIAYTIAEHDEIGFIVISKKFAERNPEVIRNFLKSFKESQLYFSKNKNSVFIWFSQDSQFDTSVVQNMKLTDQNFNANSIGDIDISISNELVIESQRRADVEKELGIYSEIVILTERIDQSYLM